MLYPVASRNPPWNPPSSTDSASFAASVKRFFASSRVPVTAISREKLKLMLPSGLAKATTPFFLFLRWSSSTSSMWSWSTCWWSGRSNSSVTLSDMSFSTALLPKGYWSFSFEYPSMTTTKVCSLVAVYDSPNSLVSGSLVWV